MAKKYIDAEKLIFELKRLQCEQGFEDGETERGYKVAIKDILRVITSFQQEQQEVDLDSALTGFMSKYAFENGGEYPSAIDIAHHFYELGLNTRK